MVQISEDKNNLPFSKATFFYCKVLWIFPIVLLKKMHETGENCGALVVLVWEGENPSTRRKTCPSITLSNTNTTLMGPKLIMDLQIQSNLTEKNSMSIMNTDQFIIFKWKIAVYCGNSKELVNKTNTHQFYTQFCV
jgi:hypothetical protein